MISRHLKVRVVAPRLGSFASSGLVWLAWLTWSISSTAQPGSVDTTFNVGIGPDEAVLVVSTQPDGKVLIGGRFGTMSGLPHRGLARLNSTGSLDASFVSVLTNLHDQVYATVIQPDGRVVVGGSFAIGSAGSLARLNNDGSLDPSFTVGSGVNGIINSIAVQSDGKVLIAGSFTAFNGVGRTNLARLTSSGVLDPSFAAGAGADLLINDVVLQSDGKVLVGGQFTSINGVARNRIARLNSNGSVDLSFDPGSGADSTVYSIAVQVDGKILIGGFFLSVNGSQAITLARLNPDGSLDNGFTSPLPPDSTVVSLALQADGKVLVAGNAGLAVRLNPDGAFDPVFSTGVGVDDDVNSIVVQPDGKVLIGGLFTSVDHLPEPYVARLNGDARLLAPAVNGNVFSASVATEPGKVYTLQYTDSLTAPGWTPIPSSAVTGDGTTKVLSGPTGTNGRRFYRLVVTAPGP